MGLNITLLNIIEKLNQKNVDYIIAGGVAVVLQGVERLTMDLDTAVSLKTDNIKKFLLTMDELGLKPRIPVPPDSLLDKNKRELMVIEKGALVFSFVDSNNPTIQVDFFMSPDLTYEKLIHDSEDMDLEGTKIKVLSKQALVKLKLQVNPMRDKDMFDIKELQRLLHEQKKE